MAHPLRTLDLSVLFQNTKVFIFACPRRIPRVSKNGYFTTEKLVYNTASQYRLQDNCSTGIYPLYNRSNESPIDTVQNFSGEKTHLH
jgi:hypothetical protein